MWSKQRCHSGCCCDPHLPPWRCKKETWRWNVSALWPLLCVLHPYLKQLAFIEPYLLSQLRHQGWGLRRRRRRQGVASLTSGGRSSQPPLVGHVQQWQPGWSDRWDHWFPSPAAGGLLSAQSLSASVYTWASRSFFLCLGISHRPFGSHCFCFLRVLVAPATCLP